MSTNLFPPTVIVRSPHENPKKCSVLPLKGRADVLFFSYPPNGIPPLANYIRLVAEGEELTARESDKGILLIDASWRWADIMNRMFLDIPPRSLHNYQTAYPRRSKRGTDPDNGLASVEALFLAYHILNRPTEGLLDKYRWGDEFLRINGLDAPTAGS
jgi:pre-rRNA-processing protein TSR3